MLLQMKDGSLTGQGSSIKKRLEILELDTTISHERKQSGTVNRQTVSAAIKDRQSLNPGIPVKSFTRHPSERNQCSIRQVLIRTVFWMKLVDLLNVLSMQFAPQVTGYRGDIPAFGSIQTLTIGSVGLQVRYHYCSGVGSWFAQQWRNCLTQLQTMRWSMYGPDGGQLAPDGEPAWLVAISKVVNCSNSVRV